MMLRQVLLAFCCYWSNLASPGQVKANQEGGRKEVPPPSFVAVVPTSIMGEFEGALFPFVIEEETTTSTTTTTPAPFGSAKEDVKAAWVLLGHKAALDCHYAKEVGQQLATVLWYRGTKGGEPIFTYDARDPGSNATSWSEQPPRGFGDRAHFDPSLVKLSVNHIKAHEGGFYRCRVDFQRSQTQNVLVNLTVIVPPDPPQILDPNGRRLGSLIGPYDEGESLSITCKSSSKGYPLPKLVWYTNDEQKLIKADTTFERLDTATRNTLTIPKLTRQHFGKTYACLAANNNATEPVATNVTIDMRLLPVTVTISPPAEPFSVARLAVLECRSSGSRPPATITWWKRGKFMGKATEEYLRDGTETITRSQITFHPKPTDHERDVVCRAENTNIQNSAVESTLTLTIHYPPKVRLSLGSSIDPEAISEGNDVYMDCDIRANPRVYKVEWSHNGMRVEPDPDNGVRILAGGKNLVLQGIQRKHNGNYTCTAYNLEGEDTSNAIAITVMYKPECIHEEPVTLGVVPKRDAEVICRMRSLPVPNRFRWTFNNSFEANDVPKSKYRSNGTLSRLNYRAESEKDFGVVHCWAANVLGETTKPCIFTLIPAGPPDPPQNCDVHNHTTQGLSVTCKVGFGGGLDQTFHMEVRDRDSGHLLQNLSNTEPIFTVSEFQTSKGVSLSIYSSNSHGRSISQVHLETAPSKVAELQVETGSHSSTGSPQFLIGIMAGLLSTLLILALLIVLVIKLHTRRHPPPAMYESSEENPAVRLNNANALPNGHSHKGPFHTSSNNDDPDLIPLQAQPSAQKPVGSASNNDSQLYCQTGLEDRPPPPSLRQHYNSYYHIANSSSRSSDIDPGGANDSEANRNTMRPLPSQQTLRMGINSTWSSSRVNQYNDQGLSSTTSFSSIAVQPQAANGGVHTSVSMVASNSGASGWPVRLL